MTKRSNTALLTLAALLGSVLNMGCGRWPDDSGPAADAGTGQDAGGRHDQDAGPTDRGQPAAEACTVVGHRSASAGAFYDPDTLGYQNFTSYSADSLERLFFDNFPARVSAYGGLDEAGAREISGADRDLSSCGVCVQATHGTGANVKVFFASSGRVDVTEFPDAVGSNFSLTLTDIVMREVDMLYRDVLGGATWCIDHIQLSAIAGRYPCFLMDDPPNYRFAAGDTLCRSNGQAKFRCDFADGYNQLSAGEICSPGTRCVDSVPLGSATCQ